jgi:predicted tellurium resistance membrane protein TerC
MKEALLAIKNFLEKNGTLKMLAAFIILIISVLFVRGDLSHPTSTFFAITGYISLVYIIVVGAIYFIVGIVNSIKDLFRKDLK